MTMRRSFRKFARRGAATIELALLTLPLAALTVGTTEFGRALHQYDTLVKNVRDLDQNVDEKYAGWQNAPKAKREKLQGEFKKLDHKLQGSFPKFYYKQN